MSEYRHLKIEKKWQKRWLEGKVYQPDLAGAKKPFYNLMMFPYPSAEGLHVGNMYAFTGADVYGRYQRMHGKDVFEPIGLDGFGIHSENYAIKVGKHPARQAKLSEKRFYRQLAQIGNGFAWENHLETYDPEYYRWTQWLFVEMFKHGLAFKKPSLVNWCPSCKTVLADEQVEGGICERCKSETVKKETEQWFFKITDYAQRLLDNIEKINWPEKIKIAQRQWIGRKEGINIRYKIQDIRDKKQEVYVTCFTTRPDTNFGATFVVLGPEHLLLKSRKGLDLTDKVWKKVELYKDKSFKKSEVERLAEGRKKTGVFLEKYCVNDLNGYKLPLYVSDFVLGHVGTGAVVGVPGHDRRDFEFAKEFGIPVIRVVVGGDGDKSEIVKPEQVQEKEGVMVNSEFLNGLDIHKATQKIMDYLEAREMGKRVVEYKLRDWCISRQRYWGPPIPMMRCPNCGWQAVPEDKLPVLLPKIEEYKPSGDGKSPLEKAPESWLFTKCPKCGGKAKRETDVSDTFLDSSWYFLRYPSIGLNGEIPQQSDSSHSSSDDGRLPWDREVTRHWLPVDAYIGGAEHAVLHLLYSRFVTMALKDWGYLTFEEPFPFLFSHGLIIKDGAKMSKSRGNVVIPDAYIKKYGADTLRIYLMFLGPYNQGGDFRDTGIAGMHRFLKRVWKLCTTHKLAGTHDLKVSGSKMHKTIKKVTADLAGFRYNTAIAVLMEYVNLLTEIGESQGKLLKREIEVLVLLLAPLAPHMAEELWVEILGNRFSVHLAKWPAYELAKTKDAEVEVVLQVNGKIRGKLKVGVDLSGNREELVELAKKEPGVIRHLEGRKIENTVFVSGKLVNFVV